MTTSRHTVEMPITAQDLTREAFASAERRVKKLDNRMVQMNTTARASNNAFRGVRGGLGQLGYQVQDVAVQLQGGQNAMLVFTQQGSQMASVFGPGGIVIGALLAVGGALAMSLAPGLMDATEHSEDLEKALEAVNKIVVLTDKNTLALTKSMGELAEENAEAAAVMLQAAAIQAEAALESAIGNIGDKLEEAFGGFLDAPFEDAIGQLRVAQKEGMTLAQIMREGMMPRFLRGANDVSKLRREILDVADAMDLSQEQAYEFMQAYASLGDNPSSAEVDKFLDAIVAIAPANSHASDAIRALQAEFIAVQREAATAAEMVDLVNEAITGNREDGELPPVEGGDTPSEEEVLGSIGSMEAEMNKIFERINKRKVESKKKYDDIMVKSEGVTLEKIAGLQATANSKMLGIVQAAKLAQATMAGYAAIQEALAVPWPGTPAAVAWATINAAANIAAIQAVSFEGGGFTGPGARVGGIDGRGGMPAIVHPNEMITDLTKSEPMRRGGDVINIYANDAKSFADLQKRNQGMIYSAVQKQMRKRGKRY